MEKSDVEQARLSTICSARAEFADFRITSRIRANPSHDTKCQPIQLSKIFVSGTAGPFRAWRNVRSPFFFKRRQNNKKSGVERRAKPPEYTRTGSRDARLFATLSS
jgi:hypothetical protein